MNNDRIFRVLYNLARRTPGVVKRQGQVFRVAAALSCKRDRILATGVNQIKSHPIMRRRRGHISSSSHQQQHFYHERQIYLHAEADAIRKALRTTTDLTKCRMHVLRLKKQQSSSSHNNRNNNSDGGANASSQQQEDEWMLGSARPCPGCMHLIEEFGIQQVFWTQDSPIFMDWGGGDRQKMGMFRQ